MPEPTWTYEVLYYLNTGTASSPTWAFVDFDNSFNPTRDNKTYDPAYKSRKVQPSFVTGSSVSIEMDIDIVEGETLQAWFIENEDNQNVPTEVLRVWKTGSSPYAAKKAAFSMNLNPFDGDANAPMRATGTLSMTDDGWTAGTATITSGTPSFTPTV